MYSFKQKPKTDDCFCSKPSEEFVQSPSAPEFPLLLPLQRSGEYTSPASLPPAHSSPRPPPRQRWRIAHRTDAPPARAHMSHSVVGSASMARGSWTMLWAVNGSVKTSKQIARRRYITIFIGSVSDECITVRSYRSGSLMLWVCEPWPRVLRACSGFAVRLVWGGTRMRRDVWSSSLLFSIASRPAHRIWRGFGFCSDR